MSGETLLMGVMFVITACTDGTGAPREIGEVWRTSGGACCAYQCVDNDTIAPIQHNCSDPDELRCWRHGEVLVSISNERTCCPQKLCGKCW